MFGGFAAALAPPERRARRKNGHPPIETDAARPPIFCLRQIFLLLLAKFCKNFASSNNPPSLRVPQSRSKAEVCAAAGEADAFFLRTLTTPPCAARIYGIPYILAMLPPCY